jgi:uncharacterized membrane protein
MNKYSYALLIIGVLMLFGAEFVNFPLQYIAFAFIMLSFLLPMIVTKATGQQFKGN